MWFRRSIEEEARRLIVCLVDDRPTIRSEGDHRHREDPEVLALDMDSQVLEQTQHLGLVIMGAYLEPGNHGSEIAMLALEFVHLVQKLAR